MKENPSKSLKIATIFSYGANEEEVDGLLDEENSEDANFSIYSITEFVQNITRDTYASNKVLSLADSRYILCKVIEYQFKDDKTKFNKING